MDFEYDIHSLVKAFFPTKALKVVSMDAPVILDSKDQEEEWSIHITIEENLLSCIFPNQENSVRIEENALRSDVKNILKRVLYQSLAEYTQTQLPWGTLTGIRPTKIPMTLLEQEMSESEILDYMKETYYISEEKGKLSIQIAKREKEILSPLHLKDGYSLYIGIPFCPDRKSVV